MTTPEGAGCCRINVRVHRDVTGAVKYRFCGTCGSRSYRRSDGQWTPWASELLWRRRFQARRNVDVIVAAAERQLGESAARAEVFGLAAGWLQRPTMGDWMTWTGDECGRVLDGAAPVIIALAEALVEGDARMALHAAAVRGRAFPRLRLALRVARDRIRGAMGRGFHRAFGGVMQRLEGASPVSPLDVP